MLIVDAHLDLAYNALRGRDVLRTGAEQTPDDEGIPTVGLPDLRAGGVGLVCATIFCEPAIGEKPGYRTPDEASAVAWQQMAWYDRQVEIGQIRFVRTASDLPSSATRGTGVPPVLATPSDGRSESPDVGDRQHGRDARATGVPTSPASLAAILLLEGADPLRTPDDIPKWYAA